ncbi:MAG: GFA family protein [Acetobacteraceae bacterium]
MDQRDTVVVIEHDPEVIKTALAEIPIGERVEGGCTCGAVRYRLDSAPMFVHCCHCRDCQRQTGSAFVLNALIETERIRLLKSRPEPVPVPTDSGRLHDIYRCPSCKTAVWSDYGRRPWLRFVRIGTLDDPALLAPDVHIFTRSKLPWITLPENAAAFDEFYDVDALWPAPSLERRRLASARADRE